MLQSSYSRDGFSSTAVARSLRQALRDPWIDTRLVGIFVVSVFLILHKTGETNGIKKLPCKFTLTSLSPVVIKKVRLKAYYNIKV